MQQRWWSVQEDTSEHSVISRENCVTRIANWILTLWNNRTILTGRREIFFGASDAMQYSKLTKLKVKITWDFISFFVLALLVRFRLHSLSLSLYSSIAMERWVKNVALKNQPEKKKWEKAYKFFCSSRVKVLLHVWTLFHIYLSVSGDCSSGRNAKIQENHSSGIRFHKMTTFVSHSKLYIEWKQIGHAHWLLAKRVNAVDIVYSFKCQQSSSFFFFLSLGFRSTFFPPIFSLSLNALKF